MRFFIAVLTLSFAPLASAHDRWTNGEPVPAWVKSACCGPLDAHHLPPEAVHIRADGYHVDGISTVTPAESVLPSPDGEYWVFWNPRMEPEPHIYCFFGPQSGV